MGRKKDKVNRKKSRWGYRPSKKTLRDYVREAARDTAARVPPPISNRERLNSFLLMLVRDVVPYGRVEDIISTLDTLLPAHRGTHRYANPHSDAYIRDLSNRLWRD
jgi:hypothetical protein